MHPLTASGGLDTSGDFKAGPHPVADDVLYKLAVENRESGNNLVKEGQYAAAIGKYSELIMQTRSLDNETDVLWNDAGRDAVRQLRAAAYLNLSLCFLKTSQWTHAINTATRAMQGDKQPPDPKEDVLSPEKKAKALFRRAQAQRDGFTNNEEALKDLRKALSLTPDDKAIQQAVKILELESKAESRDADRKMAGFLSGSKDVKSGQGIFKEKERPTDKDKAGVPEPKEPVKLSDGLWVCPQAKESEEPKVQAADGSSIDFAELGRELNEMKEDRPEVFEEIRAKMQGMLEEQAAAADATVADSTAAHSAAVGEEAEKTTEGVIVD
jgi:tetratricopeptide (TPR) repeat protein